MPAAKKPSESDPSSRGDLWEYVAEVPATYLPEGYPPQTAQRGDVCRLPFTPTDGRWRRTDAAVTRLPDPLTHSQPDRARGASKEASS